MKHYLVMLTNLDEENKTIVETLLKAPRDVNLNAQTGHKKELYWESDTVDLQVVLSIAFSLKDSLNTITFYYMYIDTEGDLCYVYSTTNKTKEVKTLGTFSASRIGETLSHENVELESSNNSFLEFNDLECFRYIRGLEYIIDNPRTTPTSLMIMNDPLGNEVYIFYDSLIDLYKDKPLKPLVELLNTFIDIVNNCDSLRELNEALVDIKDSDITSISKHYVEASGFYEFEESFNKVINNKLKNFMGSVIVEQFVDVFKPLRHRMLDVIEEWVDDLKNNEEFY